VLAISRVAVAERSRNDLGIILFSFFCYLVVGLSERVENAFYEVESRSLSVCFIKVRGEKSDGMLPELVVARISAVQLVMEGFVEIVASHFLYFHPSNACNTS
jgi:hypothetical protein